MAQGRWKSQLMRMQRTRRLTPIAVLCGLGAMGFLVGQGAAAMRDMQARLAQEAAQQVAPRQVIIRVVGPQGATPSTASTSSARVAHTTAQALVPQGNSDTPSTPKSLPDDRYHAGTNTDGNVRPLSAPTHHSAELTTGAHGAKGSHHPKQ